MSAVRLDNAPAIATRKQDISSWEEPDIISLNVRQRKLYKKRKSAIQAYFTTEDSIHEIAHRQHLSERTLLRLVQKCLMYHEDGTPWGFRALIPGVNIVNHAPSAISTEALQIEEKVPEPSKEVVDEDASPGSQDFGPATPEQAIPTDEVIEDDEDEDTATHKAIELPSHSEKSEDEVVGEASSAQTIAPEEDEANEDVRAPLAGALADDLLVTNDELGTANGSETINDPDTTDGSDTIDLSATSDEFDTANGSAFINDPGPTDAPDTTDHSGTENQPGTFESLEATDSETEKTLIPASTDEPPRNVVAPLAGTLSGGQVTKSDEHLAIIEDIVPLVLPSHANGRYRISTKRARLARRTAHKRLTRKVQNHRNQKFHRIVGGIVLAAMLFVVLIPLGAGLAAYSAYNNIRGVALDGVGHLLTVKSLIPLSKSDPTASLNPQKLQQAQVEFNSAESDFMQLQQLINRPDVQSAVQQYAPQYYRNLGMAEHLVQVGVDISRMGKEMTGVALLGATILHGSPLAGSSTKPLISVADISNAEGAMVHALYYINDIRAQMSQVSLKDLPISNSQKTQLTSVLALLPKAQDMITQAQGLVGIVTWLLGIGHERRFLVQTMDRGEIRPTGGFTGQYGILDFQDGRMAPFSLRDVTELDYNGNGVELNRSAPPEYKKWMAFGYWGLRDANLSGDYPTSARLSMQVFQEEGGGPVDGDISFTPALIEHILEVVGPIQVPGYNETITSKNLEDRLHYWQQNQAAITIQKQKSGVTNASARKTFTNLVGKLLLERVRHLQVKQLMSILPLAIKDIQSHDLEIYFTNPQAEAWLIQHGYSAAMDTFTKQDGFMVVQSNVSISKASQYVHTTEQDQVTLDAQGGATHNLTITLDYQQTGPVYGYDTYADYIRIYAPANAIFQGGNGFDTGKSLCTPSNPPGGPGPGGPGPGGGSGGGKGCDQYKTSYPSDSRYCPDGNYSLGFGYVDGKGFINWPVDSLGAPTELTSDMPGRSMWGGLAVTPKNCTSYISLSWYVPNVVQNVAGQSPYSLLVQKQGGYIPTVQITVDTSAIKGLQSFSFDGNLIADRIFSLPALKKK